MSAITYTQCGDYLLPNICITEDEANLPSLTKWGRMRMEYLKNHRPILYTDMKLSGKLFLHCHEIEQCADNRMEFMMKQAVAKNPISEELKNTNPLEWVGHMNALRASVEEIIKAELIYE
ncbi:MAG: TnpV protein [Defluviitaleaceae bacterium]|nr:TnpV protein [Defluviitaleaceae bacterium]